MTTPSLFADCQAWIEKGHKSWNLYFSKWETFAKYEEEIPGELIDKLNKIDKSRRQRKKRVKQPLSHLKLETVLLKNQKKKQKMLTQKKKNLKKTRAEARVRRLFGNSKKENFLEIPEKKHLLMTLKTIFADCFNTNTNKFEMLAILSQTLASEEVIIRGSHFSFPKRLVLPRNNSKLNVGSFSFRNQQVSSPVAKMNSGVKLLCSGGCTNIKNLHKNFSDICVMPTEGGRGQWGLSGIGSQSINSSVRRNYMSNFNNKQVLASLTSNQTQPKSRLLLKGKSCSPQYSNNLKFKNTKLKPLKLNFSHNFPSSLCQSLSKEYFKNTVISKMNTTQERKRTGNFCLCKRTNSVSLSMEISNFITPERKPSERKYFSKIVSHKRRLSKKLPFDNEEDDSESDDHTEYHAPIIRCWKKKIKICTSEVNDVKSDLDDCESIFDRVFKT